MADSKLSKIFALDNGCNVQVKYEGQGDMTWWENLIPNSWMPEDVGKALGANPVEGVRVKDGKLQLELDFSINAGCYKDEERSDRCTEPGACQGFISADMQFWIDVDMFLPDAGPPGSTPEEDKEWKDAKDKFKECFDHLFDSDSMCILAHWKYLEKALGGKGTTPLDKFVQMFINNFEGMMDEPVTDGGSSPPGAPMSGAGVPNGIADGIKTILDQIDIQDLWDFSVLCSCTAGSNYGKQNSSFAKQVQHDINATYMAQWEDILQHYVNSFWNAAESEDNDYITNIASYDEILVLAATARAQGR
tara:strand:- start:934 stop:1848 length:915 start_codon:yes stop_codon:yes gene_type:complete